MGFLNNGFEIDNQKDIDLLQIDLQNLKDINNDVVEVYSITGNGTNTITGIYPSIINYTTDLKVNLFIQNTNTESVTLNINDLGAKEIKYISSLGVKTSLEASKLVQNSIVQIQYDGTDWILISNSSNTLNSSINDVFVNDKTKVVAPTGGDFSSIQSAINWIKTNGNPTKINRWKIIVKPGQYNENVVGADGIDIFGIDKETCVLYNNQNDLLIAERDTFRCWFDMHIKNMTIKHNTNIEENDHYNYPLHVDSVEDGTAESFTLILENIKAIATGGHSHHALGMGLYGGQEVILKGVYLESEAKPAIYMHNWENQNTPCKVTILNTTIYGCTKSIYTEAVGFLVEEINSGQPDEINIVGSIIECKQNNAIDVVKRPHPLKVGQRNWISLYTTGSKIKNIQQVCETTTNANSGITSVIDLGIQDIWMQNLSSNTIYDGEPVTYLIGSNGNVGFREASFDGTEHVCGVVQIANGGNVVANGWALVRQRGIVNNLKVDGTVDILQYNFLQTKSNRRAMKGTQGNGNCFALALENYSSDDANGIIKALIVSIR